MDRNVFFFTSYPGEWYVGDIMTKENLPQSFVMYFRYYGADAIGPIDVISIAHYVMMENMIGRVNVCR